MHPNPECIYEKDGVMMAEDEEGCFEEYKLKKLIKASAAFECPSLDHNKMSPAILSHVYHGSLIMKDVLNLIPTPQKIRGSLFLSFSTFDFFKFPIFGPDPSAVLEITFLQLIYFFQFLF